MIRHDYYSEIASAALFKNAEKENLVRFLEGEDCRVLAFSGGDEIVLDSSLAYVVSGTVKVFSKDKRRNLLLRTVQKGETLGAAGVFCEGGEISRLFAKGKTELLVFGKQSVTELLSADEKVMINYISFLAGRIDYLNTKITFITAGSAERKLATYLLSVGDGDIEVPVSFSALSDMLDIGRASLYRSLDTFAADGCIERNGSRVRIIDKDKLASY